ncbi:DUF3304 domain-containing protein [Stenotrophomonas sp. GZD-301]|uniref:DUF3304 domain-containing protein n=1 Tax=Stenotrophomonas sp. GZD-301 TaxID=3404814 RepID=UPI003BB50397
MTHDPIPDKRDARDTRSGHFTDQDADTANVADDGDPRALAWFVADCVLTALFIAVLWRAGYVDGDTGLRASNFLGVVPLTILVFINGFRRAVRNHHRVTFQALPLVQCLFAIWLVVMYSLFAWSDNFEGWDGMTARTVAYVAAFPLAICAGLIYKLSDVLLRPPAENTSAVDVEEAEEARARSVELENASSSATESDDLRPFVQSYLWLCVLLLVVAAGVYRLAHSHPTKRVSTWVGGSLTSMDYEPTDTFVRPVYVNGGGGDSAGTGGSTVLTAIGLPERWYPGLEVPVKWRRCARGTYYIPGEVQDEGCRWVEKNVPVHPYTYVGRTWVHIYADDQVLVIPTMMGPNHPDYPSRDFPDKDFYERRGIGND